MSIKRVLVVSGLVHLAIFAALLRVRPAPAPPVIVAPPVTEEVTIEMEPEALPAPAAAPPSETVAMAIATRPRESGPHEAPPSAPSAEPPPDTAPYAKSSTMIVFAPNLAIMGGGSGAKNPFLTNGFDAGAAGDGEARTVASADASSMGVPLNKRAEQAVKDGLRARDQSIGLGLEGPVVHALEDATHSGFSPDRGNATFVAVIDERGIVIDLKLLASNATGSEGARGWEAVRQSAVKSLATAKIDMRGVKRAELKIEVESKVLLASGNKPEDFPIKPVAKPSSTGVSLQTAAPGPANGALGGTVAEFDVTDFHRKAGRVVHARLVLMTTR